MPIATTINVDTPQTVTDANYEIAFDMPNGFITNVEVECDSGVASVRINNEAPFRIAAGQPPKQVRRLRGGIHKLEIAGQGGAAQVLWRAAATT